jgi:hypothetical protein
MPTNRTPRERPRQRQLLTDAAIELFAELERTPQRQRGSKNFKNREHELARVLNLVPEWWSMCSVLDRSERPPWPPYLVAFADWHRCRGIREQLLEAAKMQPAPAK